MSDNWYNLIETQLVRTIEGDSYLGTGGTNIVTIEANLRSGHRAYYDHELPSIAVKVVGMRQEDFSYSLFDKFYQFIIMVVDRGGDLDTIIDGVQKYASNLENLLEAQHDSDNDLKGLGTHSDIEGGPFVDIGGSVIDFISNSEHGYMAVATLQGSVNIVV